MVCMSLNPIISDPITAGIDFVKTAINKVWPDASEAERQKLEKFAMVIKADADEQNELTKRQAADMASDSWLAKNIRPAVLAYILTAYLALSILDGLGFHVSESYITLLGQWGMVVMSFYFGGRTIEKIMGLKWKA